MQYCVRLSDETGRTAFYSDPQVLGLDADVSADASDTHFVLVDLDGARASSTSLSASWQPLNTAVVTWEFEDGSQVDSLQELVVQGAHQRAALPANASSDTILQTIRARTNTLLSVLST